MKAAATVLIATALAVIAAATVLIALQVSTMADRLDRIEDVTARNCMTGTMATLTQWANGREDIPLSEALEVHKDLLTNAAVVAEDLCAGTTNDPYPSR